MVKIGGIQKFSTVDYPGFSCASIFTIGCNMRCGYCHNPELVLPEQYVDAIPEEDILAFLQTRVGLLDAVTISGGEPTIQPDLPRFIATIKAMGFLVKLDTNGTNPEMLEQLIEDSLVDFVAMDIKGPLQKYSQISARPVDCGAITRSIGLIRLGVSHEFRTTIIRTQLTPDDFESIGKLVIGAERYALQNFVPATTLSPQLANAESFSDEEMGRARRIMNKYVKECVVH